MIKLTKKSLKASLAFVFALNDAVWHAGSENQDGCPAGEIIESLR